MSYDLTGAPDIAEAMSRLVEQDFDQGLQNHVGTYLSVASLPWVALDDLGGPEDRFGGSHAIDIDVLDASYDEAKSLCSRLVAYFLGYPRSVEVDGRKVILDRVEAQGPREIPWDDTNVRRFTATLQVTFRR